MFVNQNDLCLAHKHILLPLQSAGIQAVIAGGFMRDCQIGRPWKDIDLIVGYDNKYKAQDILFHNAEYESQSISDDDPLYIHFALSEQGECELANDDWKPTVNLIVWKESAGTPTVEDAARRINFGLCQIAWDGKTVFRTAGFEQDVKNQTFTLMRTDMGLEGSMKHWIRLQEKYPWPMVYNKDESPEDWI